MNESNDERVSTYPYPLPYSSYISLYLLPLQPFTSAWQQSPACVWCCSLSTKIFHNSIASPQATGDGIGGSTLLLYCRFVPYYSSWLIISSKYITTQPHAAPRSPTQHHAAPRSITQHHAASRSTTQPHAAPRSTTQHHAAPRSTTQHHAAPRSTTQHHAAT